MGTMAAAFAAAFRDWNTDGDATSGAYKPVKSLIRALGVLLDSRLAGFITPLEYNAKGDGITDDTAAFNAAHVAAAITGKNVRIPAMAAGYLIAGTIVALVPMEGGGRTTFLKAGSAAADVIQVTTRGVTLRDFRIEAAVTRTGGYYINSIGVSDTHIRDLWLYDWKNAVGVTGALCAGFRLDNCTLNTQTTAGGYGLLIDTVGACLDMIISKTVISGNPSFRPAAGIRFGEMGDITLSRVQTVLTANGLSVAPGNGVNCQYLSVSDSLFDSSSSNGVDLAPTGTGVIRLAKFVNTWSCSASNGFVISGSGSVLDCQLLNCTGSANVTGAGIALLNPLSKLQVIGGSYGENTYGFVAVPGCSNFTLLGVTFGASGQFAGNSQYGISIGAGADDFLVASCNLQGNTLGAMALLSPAGTPGQTWAVTNNRGLVTRATGGTTLSSGATTTVVNHGLAATPSLDQVKIDHTSGYGSATQFWISAVSSTTFTVSTNASPGSGVTVSWDARVWGG